MIAFVAMREAGSGFPSNGESAAKWPGCTQETYSGRVKDTLELRARLAGAFGYPPRVFVGVPVLVTLPLQKEYVLLTR